MKWLDNDVFLAILMGLILPGILLNGTRILMEQDVPAQTIPMQQEIQSNAESDLLVNVLWEDGSMGQMELEEYLVGVVLGEMPADFEPEALKAQAVVARTYTLRRKMTQKHSLGSVCTDSECCQEYLAPETYLQRGGSGESIEKVRSAVTQCAGLVLMYEGTLIDATYFSSSGGRTEDALAVWGSDIPYLQSTDSPEEAYSQAYLRTVTMTTEEFQNRLGIRLDGPCEGWFGVVTHTNGGGVKTMEIGDQVFEGTELRRLLGLRSTAFVMTAIGNHVTITTRGFGHRVGMSQYGAEAMAVTGSSFEEILSHYYAGTTLVQYIDKEGDLG